jgi:NhaA family Na+:H+ antiporter
VIALFYSEGLSPAALGGAAAGLALVVAMRRAGLRAYGPYWAVGIAVWLATLASGVHATVAGVLLGLLAPTTLLAPEGSLAARGRRLVQEALARLDADSISDPERRSAAQELREVSRRSLSPLERLTHTLHPWTAFLVLPIFALANAGVRIDATALADPLASRVALAVALGLLVGKPLGITLFCWLGVRLGLAALPAGVGWGAVLGAGALGGIGFTMALFITALAFDGEPALAAASKIGVMAASLVATGLGAVVLARTLPRA